jgi:arylsulfatase
MTPFGDHEWELYHLADDPTETVNLAGQRPELVEELARLWDGAAWANQVFPLDEGSMLRWVLRPATEAALAAPVTIQAGTSTLERYRSLQLIQWRSFTVAVELEGYRQGDEGVLVAHGDQGGGYAVYIEDGELVFVQNCGAAMRRLTAGAVPVGARTITLSVAAPGQWQWEPALAVDGAVVARDTGYPMLSAMCPFEGIDVGIDRRSPVCWELYQRHGPYPYTGALRDVTYTPGQLAPDAGPNFIDFLREQGRAYE